MKSAAIAFDTRLDTPWWGKRQQQMIAKVLAPLANAKTGVLSLTLPNGNSITFGDTPHARLNPHVRLHNWKAVRKAFTGGSLGWSEAYMDGDWDCDNLAALIEWVVINESHVGGTLDSGRLNQWVQAWRHRRNANSKRGSRRNIAYHYDLGNEFYEQWLDPSMTYSSAYFKEGSSSADLTEGQYAKYQRLIDLLGVTDGDSVLEIGCGWGGFAEQLLRQKDVALHGITLSTEQLNYARERLQKQGLDRNAEFSLTDYRDTVGHYDHIVSIEMLEAVGEQYWPTYFDTLYQRLKPGGKAAIQIITIDESRFEQYRSNPDFIQTYIFPGGMLPSPERVEQHAAKANLKMVDQKAFGTCYADTLAQWDRAFSANWPAIEPLGFDERFKRMWHYYLAYCEGGFRAGSIDVYQFVLEKPASTT